MATRLVLLAAVSLSASTAFVRPAFSAPASTGDPVQVENSKYQYIAEVNADRVAVRSGPGENYYETEKLNTGARVKVVGFHSGWLKIVPPDGSFSVISKNFVETADRKTGRVLGDKVNVRAGSKLNPVKVQVQCQLPKGATVEILGEDGDYWQIKPPEEAFLFVKANLLHPVEIVGDPARSTPRPDQPRTGNRVETPSEPRPLPPEKVADNAAEAQDEGIADTQSLAEQTVPVQAPAAAAPTTRPSQRVSVENEFDRLDALWISTMDKPIDQIPTAELLAGYESLLRNDHLPVSMQRVADLRAQALRLKNKAKEEYLIAQQRQEETLKQLEALRSQRMGIEQRLSNIAVFTAIGKLDASTLRSGGENIYRLTDPATDRTLCYIRGSDAKYLKLIGQIVGAKGELGTDPELSLKVITPTDVVPVEAARVNNGVSAPIMPPSMMTRTAPEAVSAETN